MGCEIKSFLAVDCKQHATNAVSTVKSHLSNSAVKEAWRALKGWYRLAKDQPPLACPETMAKQTAEQVELYAKVPPWGHPSCLISLTSRFLMACPPTMKYARW